MLRVFLTLLIFIPGTAWACFASLHIQQTFFNELPTAVAESPVIARVQIMKAPTPPKYLKISAPQIFHIFPAEIILPSKNFRVEVVEAIKGTELGQELDVNVFISSCAAYADVRPGSLYYIAGKTVDGQFFGSWRLSDLNTY